MDKKIEVLINGDNMKAFDTLKEIELISTESNSFYKYFDIFAEMLKSEKTFVRVRGFRAICSLAKFDVENKINENIDIILNELDDPVGTSLRQCLDKINLIIIYKFELEEVINNKLNNLDLNKYKETMRELIKKDIKKLLK